MKRKANDTMEEDQQQDQGAAAAADAEIPAMAPVRRSARKRRKRADSDLSSVGSQTKRVRVSRKKEPENGNKKNDAENDNNGTTTQQEMNQPLLSTSPPPPLPPEMMEPNNGNRKDTSREVAVEQQEDIEMKKQDEQKPRSTNLADSQEVLMMNGSHSSSTMTDGPSKPLAESHSVPLPTENLGRLKMPSQHTPGRALHETAKTREPEVETIGLPPTRLDLGNGEEEDDDDEPLIEQPRIEPQKKPPVPENGNTTHGDHDDDDDSPAILDTPGETLAHAASDLHTSAQQYVTTNFGERPSLPIEEEVDAEVDEGVDARGKLLKALPFRSVPAWIGLFLFLQLFFHGLLFNPILHTVVESSKSLTVFYKGVYTSVLGSKGSSVQQQSPLPTDTTAEDNEYVVALADSMALIEEKLRLREQNERIAEQNRARTEENGRRSEINKRRAEEASQAQQVNSDQANAANDQLAEETLVIKAKLNELKTAKMLAAESTKSLKATIESRMDEWEGQRSAIASLIPQTIMLADEATEAIDELSTKIEMQTGKMDEGAAILHDIVSVNNFAESKETLVHVRSLLGRDEENLLDVFQVELWEPTLLANCSNISLKKKSRGVDQPVFPSKVEVHRTVEQFEEQIAKEKERAMDEGDLRDLLEDLLYDRTELYHFDDLLTVVADNITNEKIAEVEPEIPEEERSSSSKQKPRKPNSVQGIRALVMERLEIERADQTGRIDYAAMMNGARVVRSSPSLVENLPIGNRLAAFLSWKFYGYGPEAALTPTWPPNALGQCWAFEQDADPPMVVEMEELQERKEDDLTPKRTGAMADLTIQLARPIYVDSVSIEHPPPELTDKPNTALKQFKVMGHVRADGWGDAWHLGTFIYDPRSESSRQEFRVPRNLIGVQVPQLSSITLAIDSNWGTKVSCLYRFRVHGSEDEDVSTRKVEAKESTVNKEEENEEEYAQEGQAESEEEDDGDNNIDDILDDYEDEDDYMDDYMDDYEDDYDDEYDYEDEGDGY